MRLAALAASGARTLAIVEEITAIVFLTLAVTALAGNLALQLLIHGGEATTCAARGTRRSARRWSCGRTVSLFARGRRAVRRMTAIRGLLAALLAPFRMSVLMTVVDLATIFEFIVRHVEISLRIARVPERPAHQSSWMDTKLQSLCHDCRSFDQHV